MPSNEALERVTTSFLTRSVVLGLVASAILQKLQQCFDSAKVVIKHMIEVLVPSGLMRSAPDGKLMLCMGDMLSVS